MSSLDKSKGERRTPRSRSILNFRTVLFAALAGIAGSNLVLAQDGNLPPHREGTVLLKFKAGLAQSQKDAILATVGGSVAKQIGQEVLVVNVGSGRVFGALQSLKARGELLYSEPDYLSSYPEGMSPAPGMRSGPSSNHRTGLKPQGLSFQISSGASAPPNDPSFGLQWAHRNTGQTVNGATGTAGADQRTAAAWSVTTGTNSVVVAVLDTGVQYSHPDLLTNMWNNPGGIGGCPAGTHGYNVVTSSCDPMDDDTFYNGHGTLVAGTLGAMGNNAAGIAGMNWTTSIMAVKFVDVNGFGFTSDLVTGMDWVVKAKQTGVNVRVANDSFTVPGTAFSQTLSDEIDLLASNDILFVTPAGNTAENNDTTPRYPCSYNRPGEICVGGTDQNDNLWASSCYGPNTVKMAAPAVNNFSTLRQSNYGFLNGTSFSSPEVVGAAALILSTRSLNVTDLKTAILSSVDTLPSLTNMVSTGGRLNVCKAIPACSGTAGVPGNSVRPVVTSIPQYGSLVGASTGVWSGLPTAYSYQWYRCSSSGASCSAIPGATAQTYAMLASTDIGATLAVTVKGANGVGSASVQSLPSSAIPAASSPFGINSTITDGQTLTTPVQWAANPSQSVNFVQFYIDGVLSQTVSAAPYQYNQGTTGLFDPGTLSSGTHVLGIRALSSDNRTYGFYGATVTVGSSQPNPVGITTASLPNGQQNIGYNATLAASGGVTPYSWSIVSGILPAGLTLGASTGTISGTPSSSGTSNFTVQVRDNSGQTVTKALSIAVSASGGAGGSGIAIVQSNAAEGSAVGSLAVAFSASNAAGRTILAFVRMSSATQTVSISDTGGNTYTQAVAQVQSADGHQIRLFYAKNIVGGANTVTASFSSTNNHPWLSIYEISGLSTTSPLDQTASAQGSNSASVSTGPTGVTQSANEFVFVGAGFNTPSFTGTVTAGSGDTLAQQDTTNSRAANETAVTSSAGTYTGAFSLSGAANWSALIATFLPAGANGTPTITTTTLPNGQQNASYSATLAATGGTSPYSWSITSGTLPVGLSLSASTGVISGTPTGSGTSNITVQVRDNNAQTASKLLSITINPVSAPAVTTASLPNGQQNVAYSATLAASGGVSPYSWSVVSGILPAGLTLGASTGAISGTPSSSGTSNFTVQVRDNNGQTTTKALSIAVTASAGGGGIAMVQSNAVEGSGVGSVRVAFTTGNTAGRTILAFVRMSSTTQTVSISDTAGNTYTQAVAQVQSTDGHQIRLFYAKNIVGGANTVTASFSSANNHPWLSIYEISGLSTTSPLDQTASAQGSNSVSVSTGPTAATQSNSEFVFVGSGFNTPSFNGTVTAGTGYTLAQQDTTNSRAANESLLSSSPSSFTGQFTLSNSANWSALIATFKP